MTINGTNNKNVTPANDAPLTEVQMKALNAALKLLIALPLQYKIITRNGLEFGALEVVVPKPAKPAKVEKPRQRSVHYPYGTLTRTFNEKFGALEIGDVAQVPLDLFPALSAQALQSVVTGWANNKWGTGSYKSCRTAAHIELLRLA